MTNNVPSIKIMLTAVMTVILLAACQYKDIDETDSAWVRKTELGLHFDWKDVDSIPASMRVVFYPKDRTYFTQGYTFFDVLNSDTVISLPAGAYAVTAWNNDLEHTLTYNLAQQQTAYATTGPYSPRGDANVPHVLDSIYNGQTVLDYPDYMVHTFMDDFTLQEQGSQRQVLTLTPDSMVMTVEVKIGGIKGLEYCKRVRAAVNDVKEKRYMAYTDLTEGRVAVMFDAKTYPEEDCVRARFWVFGIEPTGKEIALIFFWITGNQVYLPIDVTQAFNNAKSSRAYLYIDIEDAGLDLWNYVRAGSTGISVEAEDWEETKEITLGF